MSRAWHDNSVSVVLLIAAAAIVGGVIVVALGRGGELTKFAADVSPFDVKIVAAADVAFTRPPSALFGYNPRVTDDFFRAIALTMIDRDAEIAELRHRLAELEGLGEPRAAAGEAAAADDRPAAGQRGLSPSHGASLLSGDAGGWSAWQSAATSQQSTSVQYSGSVQHGASVQQSTSARAAAADQARPRSWWSAFRRGLGHREPLPGHRPGDPGPSR